ncbi:MAG: DUF1801 domain-containing protein [Bacilli bacterium]|nr:DUF1801 domain-containing protein [Bacilli bacterium]
MSRNMQVDQYIDRIKKWKDETRTIRELMFEKGLSEHLKWGKPCYMHKENNICIVQGFKEYIALMFFKGALLSDDENLLIAPGENSQAARQLRFTSDVEIVSKKEKIQSFIDDAIRVEESGLKVEMKKNPQEEFVDELKEKLRMDPKFKSAFERLSPGRQRAYNIYFSGAKQSATRKSRIDKFTPKILSGLGMND